MHSQIKGHLDTGTRKLLAEMAITADDVAGKLKQLPGNGSTATLQQRTCNKNLAIALLLCQYWPCDRGPNFVDLGTATGELPIVAAAVNGIHESIGVDFAPARLQFAQSEIANPRSWSPHTFALLQRVRFAVCDLTTIDAWTQPHLSQGDCFFMYDCRFRDDTCHTIWQQLSLLGKCRYIRVTTTKAPDCVKRILGGEHPFDFRGRVQVKHTGMSHVCYMYSSRHDHARMCARNELERTVDFTHW